MWLIIYLIINKYNIGLVIDFIVNKVKCYILYNKIINFIFFMFLSVLGI